MSFILPILIFGLGYGAASKEVRVFERRAASDIYNQLGGENRTVEIKTKLNLPFGAFLGTLDQATITAKHFSTEGLPLFTDPGLPKTGHVRKLGIELEDFVLKGLRIDRLSSVIPDCRYDRDLAVKRKQIRLSKSGIGDGWVRILEADLARYIPTKVKEIKRCIVKLDKNKAWVEGYGEFLIAKTDFLVVADLVIEDGVRLNLANARVVFGWRKADDFSKKVLLDAMNPVVDLQKDLGLLDAFFFERIEISGGALIAHGKTKIPDRPKAN